MPRHAAADTLRLERDHALELLGHVSAERDWLRAEIERRGVELAEMRRLVLGAQHQLAAPETAPTRTEAPESGLIIAETAQNGAAAEALSEALKDVGVKKKQRRRLLSRLAAVWRGA